MPRRWHSGPQVAKERERFVTIQDHAPQSEYHGAGTGEIQVIRVIKCWGVRAEAQEHVTPMPLPVPVEEPRQR